MCIRDSTHSHMCVHFRYACVINLTLCLYVFCYNNYGRNRWQSWIHTSLFIVQDILQRHMSSRVLCIHVCIYYTVYTHTQLSIRCIFLGCNVPIKQYCKRIFVIDKTVVTFVECNNLILIKKMMWKWKNCVCLKNDCYYEKDKEMFQIL